MKEEYRDDSPEMKKAGRGSQSNSANWSAAYNPEVRKYFAKLQFSSASGSWLSYYEIPRETFEKLGTFDRDDYVSERLIRKGKLLYKYENERNYPEPTEIVKDPDYICTCWMLLD